MKSFFFFFFFLTWVNGCGYTTHPYVRESGYRTIYVQPFVNKVDTTSEFSEGRRFATYFPLLENKITNAIVDRYIFDGSLKISKAEDADLILKGELVDYRKESLKNSTAENPEEYRINLFVHLTLVDRKANKILWEKKDFAGDTTYFTSGSFSKTESQAVDEATKDLARRIIELTVEAW